MLKIAGATFEKTPFLYLQDIGSKAILSSQLGICAVTCVSMMNTLIIILWRVINVVICLKMILPWKFINDDHICSDDCSGRLLQHRWKTKALQVVGQAEGESSSSSGELRLLASGQ